MKAFAKVITAAILLIGAASVAQAEQAAPAGDIVKSACDLATLSGCPLN